jgi:hypothetical protein
MIYNQNGMFYNPISVIQDMKVYALPGGSRALLEQGKYNQTWQRKW